MDSIVNITEDYNEYVLLEEVNFMTISGTARQTKNNENVSGDNFAVMNLNSGQTFMSICDGMGSGKRAGWKCHLCETKWTAVIVERTRGKGKCPKCSKH